MPITHVCGFDEEIRPDAVPEAICVVHDMFACHKPFEKCWVKMLRRPEIQQAISRLVEMRRGK